MNKHGTKAIAGSIAALLAIGGAAGTAQAHGGKRYSQETEFTVRIENVSNGFAYSESGAFAIPSDSAGPADGPGPALPGSAYEFGVHANPGDRLSLATMLVQSNDWFFAPAANGLALYDGDTPISGDVTSQFLVVDAGTEIDQPAGEGADQAPRQSGPNTGAADPNPTVRLVTSTPAVSDLIKVNVTPGDGGMFTIRVENVSGDSDLPTPLAPGAYAIHSSGDALYTLGEEDRGHGLEAIAEDGDPSMLADALAAETGVATPLAPGVYTTASGSKRTLFRTGRPDRGEGLEGLAEDGAAGPLGDVLIERFGSDDAGVFAVPAGAEGPGPVLPGEAYEFTVSAKPGDRLNFATMFVQSNDWFFAPSAKGVNLFGRSGKARSGDISKKIRIFDAGTEVDQTPGFGPDQAPRQSGPDTGADDSNNRVRRIARDATGYVKVTVTPVDQAPTSGSPTSGAPTSGRYR